MSPALFPGPPNLSTTMNSPTVAVIGPAGFVGTMMVPVFIDATTRGTFKHLKLLSSSTSQAQIVKWAEENPQRVTVAQIDWVSEKSLTTALKDVDVLVSIMNVKRATEDSRKALIWAALKSGVSLYLPSEWGLDHRIPEYKDYYFDLKQRHSAMAEKMGLRTVSVYTGLIMEPWICPWFGFDPKANSWIIPGDGTQRVSFTSTEDLGKFVTAIITFALNEPQKCPSHLRICSENRTWDEYAEIMEQASGERITRNYVDVEELQKNYDEALLQKEKVNGYRFYTLIPLLEALGKHDFSENHNELVNPAHKYFVPKTFSQFAKETGGKPWLTGLPSLEDGSPMDAV